MKRIIKSLIFLAILIILAVFLAGVYTSSYNLPNSRLYSSPVGYPSIMRYLKKPIKVKTTPAGERDMIQYVSASGVVGFLNIIPVNIEVTGIVTDIYAQEGSSIKAGQELLFIDSGGYDSRMAELSLELKKSEYQQAKSDYEREKEALKEGLIPSSEFEQYRLKFEEASVALAQAKEVYKKSKRSISRKVLGTKGTTGRRPSAETGQIEILSPVSGTIVRKNIFEGENLVTSTKNAVEIGDRLLFQAALDQRYVSTIKKGDEAKIYLMAHRGQPFTGKVIRVDRRISEGSSARTKSDRAPYTFLAWIALPEEKIKRKEIVSGMNGYAVFEYPLKALAIPESALMHFSGNEGLVMTVNASDRIEIKKVTYSTSAEGWVAITSGLTKDDPVITSGQVGLEPGDIIETD